MDNLRKSERNLLYRKQMSNNNNDIVKPNNNLSTHINKVRDFDINLYEKGKEWQKNGLPLSGASETYRKNMSFLKGYDKENKLLRIEKRKDR